MQKTHKHLQDLAIYGDKEIKKNECLNHVAKRLGTGIRNIVKDNRKSGITLGGKKFGSLKEDTIVKLTNYYRKAIKNNIPDVQQMKTAIYATLYHCMSTDQNPQHHKCPCGETSWCFYNRAVAKAEPIPRHDNSTMKTPLNNEVVKKLIPLYSRLANEELLQKCTSGKTQNANEALHSIIWSKCPKDTFVSRKKLEIGVTSAVSQFNMGCLASQKLKEEVTNLKFSPAALKIGKARDHRRLQRSKLSCQHISKSARKKLRLSKLEAEEKKKKEEGVTYGAGQF